MPSDWLKENITNVFKKGSKHLVVNYRPISLTAVPCKILEHIILHDIMAHLDTNHIQYWLTPNMASAGSFLVKRS